MAQPLFARLTRRPLSEPLSETDAVFLLTLYTSTRAAEMAFFPWTPDQKAAFLKQQFDAQHIHYHAHSPHAAYDLLLLDDIPIGRIYVDRRLDEICVLDIALLPEFRGRGWGTALLQELIAESEASLRPIRLHVGSHNPAFRLYSRLGFQVLDDSGLYIRMERVP